MTSTAGLNFDGMTTGEVYSQLQSAYTLQHGELSTAKGAINGIQQEVQNRYEDLNNSRVDPLPKPADLQGEYEKFHSFYLKHQSQKASYTEQASRLTDSIQLGLRIFEPCKAYDEATIEGYKSIDQALHSRMVSTHTTCMAQMQEIQQWWQAASSIAKEIDASLLRLNSSLTLLRGIVRNDGKPTSLSDPRSLFTAAKTFGKFYLGFEAKPIAKQAKPSEVSAPPASPSSPKQQTSAPVPSGTASASPLPAAAPAPVVAPASAPPVAASTTSSDPSAASSENSSSVQKQEGYSSNVPADTSSISAQVSTPSAAASSPRAVENKQSMATTPRILITPPGSSQSHEVVFHDSGLAARVASLAPASAPAPAAPASSASSASSSSSVNGQVDAQKKTA